MSADTELALLPSQFACPDCGAAAGAECREDLRAADVSGRGFVRVLRHYHSARVDSAFRAVAEILLELASDTETPEQPTGDSGVYKRVNLDQLRALALAAKSATPPITITSQSSDPIQVFIQAASPDVVLELIRRIRARDG